MTVTASNARWRYRADCTLAPFELVVMADGLLDSAGCSDNDLNAIAGSLSAEDWHQLRIDGLPLDPIELTVHALASEQVGFGAFAAACVRLIIPSHYRSPFDQKVRPYTADEMGDSERSLGRVLDRVSGPPVIVLGRSAELADVVLFTWHGRWQGFRSVLRADFILRGRAAFHDAFRSHPREVSALLGDDATFLLGPGSCAN